MSHLLDDVLHAQKRGEAVGIPSICSAHPWVLKTALRGEEPILIESTCNQVNQDGGYTGMTPEVFAAFVHRLAVGNGFPPERLILGGDHLGPSPWQDDPRDVAMTRAAEMVRAYVRAGYTKIHLDASMKLGDDDPSRPLELEVAARRTAFLAQAAEESLAEAPKPSQGIRYVIGTEVPIPGGTTTHEESVRVTTVEDTRRTLEVTRAAFGEAGLESAWEQVVAMVVQPGVEFGDDFVLDYKSETARGLACYAETTPFIYEAHSTDYQRRDSLRALVSDHFAILKVGPALTFAFREAVFSLAMIEEKLVAEERHSHLIETLEAAMLREPHHWQKYYHGAEQEQAERRKFSLSDRIRYYWPDPTVQAALEKLLANLKMVELPLSLISQHLPEASEAIRTGRLQNSANSIISYKVKSVLDDYSFACGNKSS
jgi:D-tagatose-1,6-bisphosphate aldolase subunit GatZ/KbaZ